MASIFYSQYFFSDKAVLAVKPTPTPIPFYSPPDPNIINAILGIGVMICLIILTGVWINRKGLKNK